MVVQDIQKQKMEWKRKGWSIPEFRGSKQEWYSILQELMNILKLNAMVDMNVTPDLKSINNIYPWRNYAPFLKGIGLATNKSGMLGLTDLGKQFCELPEKRFIANLLHEKYRLFGETLALLQEQSKTVEEVDGILCREYSLDWANLSNTRRRTDWLEVLGLIEAVGNRKWGITLEGRKALEEWPIITSEVVDNTESDNLNIQIMPAPTEIEGLLKKLEENPTLHKKRNTYNIWIPSPNRIENLRTIVQYALEKVTRAELFGYIENQFQLKASSVESMMPFLKADGLIEEVGKSVYLSTPAAKAWCESGNDLDLIRIMHANRRFVGEMILAAKEDTTRNEIYAEAAKYGVNTEKSRWMMGLLLEAGVLEETQYLHVKSTELGNAFATTLPMMTECFEKIQTEADMDISVTNNEKTLDENKVQLFENLSVSARDPMAE